MSLRFSAYHPFHGSGFLGIACFFLVLGLPCSDFAPAAQNQILLPAPPLKTGQTFLYQFSLRSEKKVKTDSNIAAPMAPAAASSDIRAQVRVEIKLSDPARAILRSSWQFPDASPTDPEKFVDFSLTRNGTVGDIVGLDAFSPDQQAAWRAWLSQFGLNTALPEKGVRLGEKWKSQEEETGAPLSGLFWEKEWQYVRDDACPESEAASPCAVILVSSSLKQKSSAKDATPPDYKLHGLHTAGTATGKTETIAYLSLSTRTAERVTEQTSQLMDVTLSKADGSNYVHYTIDAVGRTQLLQVTISDPAPRGDAHPQSATPQIPKSTP